MPDEANTPSPAATDATCLHCGYHLAGLGEAEVCPECGDDPLAPPAGRDGLVTLFVTSDAALAAVAGSTLAAAGIRCEPTAGVSLFGVRVPRDQFRAALREWTAARARNGEGIDWDALNLGDAPDESANWDGRCRRCRYDVSTLPDAAVCPECGGVLPQNQPPTGAPAVHDGRRSRRAARRWVRRFAPVAGWIMLVTISLMGTALAAGVFLPNQEAAVVTPFALPALVSAIGIAAIVTFLWRARRRAQRREADGT